ncbi:MAG: penicillin acylase family protein [Dokdonella sp.]|nr:penicillin acylase family protein [Dokdonella sp.]
MASIQTTLRRSAIFLLLVALAALAAAWLALRASLPRADGLRSGSGVAAAVRVERDALGTVTIRAGSRPDAAWALGYVHAQERWFGMDLARRSAAGELAELFGPLALPADRRARAHRMRASLQAAFAALPVQQRALIEAYRDGVNAGLADLSARPFEYFLLRATPSPWRSEDTLLVVAAMAFTLNDAQNRRELALAQLHASLPAAAYAFLTATGGPWDAPLTGAALARPPAPTEAQFDLHALPATPPPTTTGATVAALVADGHGPVGELVPGSNSFAVAGSLTGAGALVANDMHLSLRVPNIWFRARLSYPDPANPALMIDANGATLPGAPAIVVGSNGTIAWGFTNSEIDAVDWVRVQRDPADAGRYRTATGWQALRVHDEVIKVARSSDEHLRVEETHWGPILATDVDGTPLALAWSAQQPGGIDVGIGRMETARSLDAALAIAHDSGMPAQNLLVGDRDGHIAWTIAGRIPQRRGGYDPQLPADWSQADTGWDGWLAGHDYPVLRDPADDRIWTANQRIVAAPELAVLGDAGYDLGARAGQIRDDLRARERFAPRDLLAIQLDDRALFLERWKDLLQVTLAAAPTTPLRDSMRRALGDWDGRADTASVAYRLVCAWRNAVIERLLDAWYAPARARFADFTAPRLPQGEYLAWTLLHERPPHLLPSSAADWDAVLLAAGDQVGAELARQPGGIAASNWGERNTARIDHPISRVLPAFIARWLDMPHEPLPGDANMPRVQAPDFGASERFAVMPGDEAHGYFMMPGGQGGHPLSPWYGAGHEDWVHGRPTPFLPGPTRHVLELTP